MTKEKETCSEETAGYDGMFGIYCSLPKDHSGPHNDGFVEWDYVDPQFRNSDTPANQGTSKGAA